MLLLCHIVIEKYGISLPETINKILKNYTSYIPNKETIEAIKESENIIQNPHKYKGYKNINLLIQALEKELADEEYLDE